MAEQTHHTEITDVALAKMAAASQKGEKVNIVAFAVGDGGGASYTPTPDMTALKNETWRGNVTDYEIDPISPNLLNVHGVVPHDVGGWTIREVGIFDAEGDLIAISSVPETVKVITGNGATQQLAYTLVLALAHADSVEIVIDPNVVTASKSYVENSLEAHNKNPDAHGGILSALRTELDDTISTVNDKLDEFQQYIDAYAYDDTELMEKVSDMQEGYLIHDRRINDLTRDLSALAFDLAVKDLLDTGGLKNIAVDKIEAADDVVIVSGKYADGKVYI